MKNQMKRLEPSKFIKLYNLRLWFTSKNFFAQLKKFQSGFKRVKPTTQINVTECLRCPKNYDSKNGSNSKQKFGILIFILFCEPVSVMELRECVLYIDH